MSTAVPSCLKLSVLITKLEKYMRFGKNGNKERARPQIPPVAMATQTQQHQRHDDDRLPVPMNLDDLKQLEKATEDYYEERGRMQLPEMTDVANGINKVITEQYGKRSIPNDIPEVYQNLIKQLHREVRDFGNVFIDVVKSALDLEEFIVARHRAHDEYMKREADIAKRIKEKYGAIKAEITAELDNEKAKEG